MTICIAAIIWILNQTNTEELSSQALSKEHPVYSLNPLIHILLGLLIIIITSRLFNLVLRYFYQPSVISEMIAGIAIGPSFFGLFFPETYNYIFPDSIIPYFGNISQLGIVLYMFIVGLEVDFTKLKKTNKSIVAIAKASIIIPFTLGALLALWLYDYQGFHSAKMNNFTVFALFIGISMSITAFPVLARILTDQKLQKSTLGGLAMTCAAVNDVVAWCLLAIIIGITQTFVSSAIVTIFSTLAFIIIMLIFIKPLLQQLSHYICRHNYTAEQQIALVFIGILTSALMAEYIGIHAIFGAFLLGVITPRDNIIIEKMSHHLQEIVTVIFLPTFFAYIGLKTQINLIGGIENWLLCMVIVVIATLGKFGGTYFTARLFDINHNTAARLSILMNTRGLVELVVLNIGLEAGIITPQLFTILVIMAIITTCTTGPILHMLKPKY